MPAYVTGLRNRLRKVWLSILDGNKLPALEAMIDVNIYKDQTALDSVMSKRMQSFATSDGGSTFEHAIEYARWMSWVFHQDNVKNKGNSY